MRNTEATDSNLLYDVQFQLDDFHFYDEQNITAFATVYFSSKGTQDRIHAALTPVLDRYREALEEQQFDFRQKLGDFIRLYAFISQLLPIPDGELEKFYQFARHLIRKLPASQQRLPLDVQQNIELESYRIQQTHSGNIRLERGVHEVSPITAAGTGSPSTEKLEALSHIIQEINQRFGTDFSEDERVFIERLELKLDESKPLQASTRVNSPENIRLTFNNITSDLMQEMIETNFNFYKQFNDDQDFSELLMGFLFNRYMDRKGDLNSDMG
ncbi:cytochrome P450 [Aetokthonos hydrillicola Thurmond2011]|uniref:Cytochrome P450 n=1 Tax=Aetokthonos hydrillicola Thurmond2011 TaxID=2712845 RepID=A0AAP5IFF1_9CYAN|nr:hypothetical protein [Aetokthonos hydrillicola]MBW4590144.1 cytochrome P450 [Aetokthonos hydrillicola CCALA 1050]MDR9900625.1 cytochrome P450 [Aetokthonos hydrillicola Thurmond2011]